jgi:hypothetical protein
MLIRLGSVSGEKCLHSFSYCYPFMELIDLVVTMWSTVSVIDLLIIYCVASAYLLSRMALQTVDELDGSSLSLVK